MKKRHPFAVVAMTLVTFGVYAYYWLYQTTEELRRERGRDDLSPAVDVLLAIVTFGVWGVWAGYRNARIAHELLEESGVPHADRALVVGGFAAAGMFSGGAWLVALALLQEDLNRVAELDHMSFAPARPYTAEAARVRVAPAASDAPIEHPAPASRWESAPSPPVFESTAPAPVVF